MRRSRRPAPRCCSCCRGDRRDRTDLPPSVFGYLLSNQLVKLFQTLWCRHVICPFYSCISPHLTIKWLNLPSSYLPMFLASYDVGRRDLGCRTFLSCISKGFGGFCSRLLRLRTGKLSAAFRLHGFADIF